VITASSFPCYAWLLGNCVCRGEHPRPDPSGAVLTGKLHQLRCPNTEIARLLSLSRQSLYYTLAGKQSITPRVALRAAKITGTSAEMWLGLQQTHDLVLTRRQEAELISHIPVLAELW
jgi:antitoxin HigA-1